MQQNNMENQPNKAFELHKIIVENVRAIREKNLENYLLLDSIQEEELYKTILGDEDSEFVAYLADVDIFYTRAKVERWKLIRKKLMKEMELDYTLLLNVPEFRLEEIARYGKDKQTVLELLEQAKTLLSFDWANVVLALRGKQTMEECSHKFKEYEICSTCSFRHKKE